MAGGAENVEALAAALENFFGDREGHDVAGIVADLSGVEVSVFVELSAGDGAFDWRTRGALVGEEVAARERILARLHVHVDAAGGGQGDHYAGGSESAAWERLNRRGIRGIPLLRKKRARIRGTQRNRTGAGTRSYGICHSAHADFRRRSFSWAPPKPSAGQGFRGIGACPRDRISCRKRTRSGRNDLSTPRANRGTLNTG